VGHRQGRKGDPRQLGGVGSGLASAYRPRLTRRGAWGAGLGGLGGNTPRKSATPKSISAVINYAIMTDTKEIH